MHMICYEKTFKNILLGDVAVFSHMSVRGEGATPIQMTNSGATELSYTTCKDP